MKYFFTALVLSSTLLANTQLQANDSFWKNSSGAYVKTSQGECWRAAAYTAGKGECGSMNDMAEAPAPAMKPKAAMAAAPVMASTPAPAMKAATTEMTDEPVIKEVINLKGVTFKTGSNEIKSSSNVRLNISAVDLKRNPDLMVIVAGHTDNVGNAKSNRELSQKRAEAVKAYLVGRGVDASRLSARGFGDSEPSATNATAVGRAKNRRVELRIH